MMSVQCLQQCPYNIYSDYLELHLTWRENVKSVITLGPQTMLLLIEKTCIVVFSVVTLSHLCVF